MIRTRSTLRGMSLIEVIVASALLSVVAYMSLIGIQATGTQAHFTSRRADLTRRANATLIRLERELEGASYTDQDNAVGAFNSGTRDVTFAAAGTAGQTGVGFTRITGFNTATGLPITGAGVVYAFEQIDTLADTDGDGLLGEFRLVRIQGGVEVVIQDNILSGAQTGVSSGAAPVNPSFTLNAPSDLQITFSLGGVVGLANGVRQVEVVTATRNLNLRNLNQ